MVTKQQLNNIDENHLQNAHTPIIIMIQSTLPAAFVLHQGRVDEKKSKALFDQIFRAVGQYYAACEEAGVDPTDKVSSSFTDIVVQATELLGIEQSLQVFKSLLLKSTAGQEAFDTSIESIAIKMDIFKILLKL